MEDEEGEGDGDDIHVHPRAISRHLIPARAKTIFSSPELDRRETANFSPQLKKQLATEGRCVLSALPHQIFFHVLFAQKNYIQYDYHTRKEGVIHHSYPPFLTVLLIVVSPLTSLLPSFSS